MLTTLLRPEVILTDLDAKNADDALDHLSSLLFEYGYVRDSFSAAVKEREKRYATGLPARSMGVAMPHTDIEHVIKPCVAIATLRHPVTFIAMGSDDEKVQAQILFMLALNEPHAQLEMLQSIVTIIQNDDLLQAIKASNSPADIIELIRKQEM